MRASSIGDALFFRRFFMKRGLICLVGVLLLAGCEAVRAERLEGYWVNRNTESSCYNRKAIRFAPFDGVPENAEDFAGIYRIAYLVDGEVVKDSVSEGLWRIVYAPSRTAGCSVYALFLAPDGNRKAEQRFELRFDGDRLILADFEKPDVIVERYSRVGTVNGL